MLAELRPTEKDDPGFIRVLKSIIDGVLGESKPDDLYVVAIDNWFDHKWLGFSGIGVVPFEFPAFMNREDALGEFRQYHVTLPPFSPKRVISQHYFHRQGAAYVEVVPSALLHGKERKRSQENLNRRIGDISPSGSFVWYSSNTTVNVRASIMVYTVKSGQIETWFAAFRKENGWKLHLTKGIDKDRVQGLLSPSPEKWVGAT